MTREALAEPALAGLEPPALAGTGAVSRQVTDWLAARIIAGDVAPGTMLSENGLCALVGVSRQPVREALLRLSLAGLVRIHAQRGSMVTRISAGAVRRAQMVREAVEAEALARAMARDAPGLARALAAELDLQRTLAAHGDAARFYASDEAFHRALCDASGIAGLWGEIGGLKAQLDRVRNLDLRAAPALPVLIDQHEALRAAVAAGDGRAAEAALRAHLRRVLDGLPGTMARHPDHFEPEGRPA